MDWSIDNFLESVYRKSHSEFSKRFYSFGVKAFKTFCEEQRLEVSQDNVYEVVDKFVASPDARHVKAKTTSDYVAAIWKFLVFKGLKIDELVSKTKVSMPKVTKINDEPLTLDTVRTLLTKGRPAPQTRALILLLLSSGMRIGEAVNIRVGDLNLQSTPATVQLKAEYTKTRTQRIAYMSDEARDALNEVVPGADKNRLVFEYSGGQYQKEKLAGRTFLRVLARAGDG